MQLRLDATRTSKMNVSSTGGLKRASDRTGLATTIPIANDMPEHPANDPIGLQGGVAVLCHVVQAPRRRLRVAVDVQDLGVDDALVGAGGGIGDVDEGSLARGDVAREVEC